MDEYLLKHRDGEIGFNESYKENNIAKSTHSVGSTLFVRFK